VLNWYDKPFSLRPLVCARYGYKCIESDLIECADCGSKLSFQIPQSQLKYLDSELIERHADHFITRMQNSHLPHCVYHNNPCPVQFILFAHQYISFYGNEQGLFDVSSIAKVHQAKLSDRLSNILLLPENLIPKLTDEFCKDYLQKYQQDIHRVILEFFPELLSRNNNNSNNNSSTDTSIDPLVERSFWIALFSWKVRPISIHNTQNKMFSCDYCQARVPLTSSLENIFDPYHSHRWWCPCIHQVLSMEDIHPYQTYNEVTIVTTEDTMRKLFIPDQLPGWQQVFYSIRSLKTTDESAFVKYDKMDMYDKLRHASRLLNATLSPAYLRTKRKRNKLLEVIKQRERDEQHPTIQQDLEQSQQQNVESRQSTNSPVRYDSSAGTLSKSPNPVRNLDEEIFSMSGPIDLGQEMIKPIIHTQPTTRVQEKQVQDTDIIMEESITDSLVESVTPTERVETNETISEPSAQDEVDQPSEPVTEPESRDTPSPSSSSTITITGPISTSIQSNTDQQRLQSIPDKSVPVQQVSSSPVLTEIPAITTAKKSIETSSSSGRVITLPSSSSDMTTSASTIPDTLPTGNNSRSQTTRGGNTGPNRGLKRKNKLVTGKRKAAPQGIRSNSTGSNKKKKKR
jgi:hypothetical protein